MRAASCSGGRCRPAAALFCSGCWTSPDSAATAGNPGRTEPGRAAIDATTGADSARRRNDGRPGPASPSGSARWVGAVGEFARTEAAPVVGSAAGPPEIDVSGTEACRTEALGTEALSVRAFGFDTSVVELLGTGAP